MFNRLYFVLQSTGPRARDGSRSAAQLAPLSSSTASPRDGWLPPSHVQPERAVADQPFCLQSSAFAANLSLAVQQYVSSFRLDVAQQSGGFPAGSTGVDHERARPRPSTRSRAATPTCRQYARGFESSTRSHQQLRVADVLRVGADVVVWILVGRFSFFFLVFFDSLLEAGGMEIKWRAFFGKSICVSLSHCIHTRSTSL